MPTRPGPSAYIAACLLAALATGCDTTGPASDAPFDTETVLEDYDAVEGLIAADGFEALRALGGRTPFAGAPAGVGPTAAPIISDVHRGVTFVYDPEADEYVIDPERSGAPPTGVRFVLYEVDLAGLPLIDEEIGHADLVDEGDGSAEDVVLRLTVVVHGRTALDYRTTLDVGVLWGEVGVLGFLEGERGTRLDFDIAARGEQSGAGGTLDVDFEMGVESRGFSISGSVSGAESGQDGQGDVQLTVVHRRHRIDVDMSGENGQLGGTIFLDGEPFALVSGHADNPTIVSGDGDPLTFEEIVVLRRVVDIVEDVFDFLEDLVDPVDDLVLAGIIL
jgi:hypothetical protein